jgi:hypothetical protein
MKPRNTYNVGFIKSAARYCVSLVVDAMLFTKKETAAITVCEYHASIASTIAADPLTHTHNINIHTALILIATK